MRDRRYQWGEQPAWRVLIAAVIVVAAVVILVSGAGHHAHSSARDSGASRPVVLTPMPATITPQIQTTKTSAAKASRRGKRSSTTRERIAAQDPQDRHGTAASKRAARALASHRALQHVPYRDGQVTIRLTGALRDGRAVLTVTAPTLKQARRGYRRFLTRYHDNGRAYHPRFVVRRARHRG